MEREPQLNIKNGRTTRLFSRGILATKLEVIGFSFEEAYELSIKVSEEIIEKKIDELVKRELDQIVYEILIEYKNEETANQYLTVEKWRDSDVPLRIIIAGAIGVGKTVLSRKIAGDLGIQHIIGTEVIRDVLRKTLSAEIAPELHAPSYLAYNTLRPIYSARYDDIIIGFENHSKFVNIGVQAVLNRASTENVSAVIEGEHLLPSYINDKLIDLSNVLYVTLSVKNEELHLKNLTAQYTQEKEELINHFDKIRKIHDYLVHETRLRKLELIEVKEDQDPIIELRKFIIKKIKHMIN